MRLSMCIQNERTDSRQVTNSIQLRDGDPPRGVLPGRNGLVVTNNDPSPIPGAFHRFPRFDWSFLRKSLGEWCLPSAFRGRQITGKTRGKPLLLIAIRVRAASWGRLGVLTWSSAEAVTAFILTVLLVLLLAFLTAGGVANGCSLRVVGF